MISNPRKNNWSSHSLLDYMRMNQLDATHSENRIPLKQITVKKKEFFYIDRNPQRLTLNPESAFKIIWDGFILLITICNALIIPLIIILPDESLGSFQIIELCSCLFFLIDILINLNTAFYIKGHLNSNRMDIFTQYVKGKFLLDILSIAPVSIFLSNQNLIKYCLLFKLYRVFCLYSYFATIDLVLTDLFLMKISYYFKILLTMSILFHWLTCLWLSISTYDLSHMNDSWIVTESIDNFEFLYLKSFYYVVTTAATLGYGDYHPTGLNEEIVALVILIIGVMIFSFNITIIIDNVIEYRRIKINYHHSMIDLNIYMKQKSLPPFLEFRLRKYLEYTSKKNNKTKLKESHILALLSDPLREEIFEYTIAGTLIQKCRVFLQIYEGKIIRKLSKFIQNKFFGPNDVVFEEADKSTQMYFIIFGSVEVFDKKTQTVFKILKRHDYFGEIGFFTKSKRTAAVRCVEVVEMLLLEREKLDLILEKFPNAAASTKQLELKCGGLDYSILGVKCYLCKKPNHVASRCPNIRLSPDRLNIPERWVNSKVKSKVINPKSYHTSKVYRKYKSNKVIKSKIPESIEESSKLDNPELQTVIKKISIIRLDTIHEEEIKAETQQNLEENGIQLVLSSEGEEIPVGFSTEPQNKLYRYSVSKLSEDSSEELEVVDVI